MNFMLKAMDIMKKLTDFMLRTMDFMQEMSKVCLGIAPLSPKRSCSRNIV